MVMIILLSLVSCTEEIDRKFKTGKPQLVVDGFFTDQQQDHFVKLSLSSSFLSNKPNPPLSGAQLSLSDGYSEIILNELSDQVGTYRIPKSYRGIYGRTYTLKIAGIDIDSNGTDESYVASNTLNPVVNIDSIALVWSSARGQKQWQVLLYSREPEETTDYYAFGLFLNDKWITPKLSDLEYAEDKFYNGNDIVGAWVQSVVEEDTDGEATEHILKEGDWVKLEMQNINKDYFDFILAVDAETGIKVPLFSGPPANVPTNISNGGRGFFRVYSLVQDSVKVSKEILEQRE
ncbi:protein of unknown function [Saccharicrinis carchari]|uniref:DUF4249 domain-containing protein n=2 Tax=Saccharicrinis carchari TaxID=1168039 RepID=A0A521DU69_SACCC|nr:protein of unknown function [Saccharicrinis carchari]